MTQPSQHSAIQGLKQNLKNSRRYPSNQIALGTRSIGVQFQYDIRFQRPQKPPRSKIKLILKQILEYSRR